MVRKSVKKRSAFTFMSQSCQYRLLRICAPTILMLLGVAFLGFAFVLAMHRRVALNYAANSQAADLQSKLVSSISSGNSNLCSSDKYCEKYADWPVKSNKNYTYCYVQSQADMAGSDFCESTESHEVAIVVSTQASHYAQREAIRDTWASFLYDEKPASASGNHHSLHLRNTRNKDAILLFFVTASEAASPTDELENRAAMLEARLHGDMLFTKLTASHLAAAKRTMFLYEFVSTCNALRGSHYLLRLHDDTFVNMKALKHLLDSLKIADKRDFIVGKFVEHEPIHRSPLSVHYVPEGLLPDSKFPPYIQSHTYLIPVHTVLSLFKEALCVRLVYIDEVILNGLLAQRLGVYLSDTAVFTARNGPDVTPDLLVVAHCFIDADSIRRIWKRYLELKN